MFRSLRGRLTVLLLLLAAAALAAGALMLGLFNQSATAQAGQAEAQIGRACDAIAGAYRFYSAGWQGPASGTSDESLRRGLSAVVLTALRERTGIEGGIWQAGNGSLAYAFPTYQGSGPKTDVPQAELPRIRAVNRAARSEDNPAVSRYDAATQILLVVACPLPGPLPNLTAWAMTRVFTLAGSGYRLLMTGLGVLLAAVLGATALLARLMTKWPRHVGQIEAALRSHDIAELPVLPATGERDLDRIVAALNDAVHRLANAKRQADLLARQVSAGERLAAIGRVAAGVAHEVRNPIAAMRLKAENAMSGEPDRKDQALAMILGQIDRLDGLVRRLLSVTERDRPCRKPVVLLPFLRSCADAHAELARANGIALRCRAGGEAANFDPDQMRRALDNLVLNAIEAAPAATDVLIDARYGAGGLVVSVHDQGPGPPVAIREHLFEPFVTGRADGTGLGLSIVREVAEAHGGMARLGDSPTGTLFEIAIP